MSLSEAAVTKKLRDLRKDVGKLRGDLTAQSEVLEAMRANAPRDSDAYRSLGTALSKLNTLDDSVNALLDRLTDGDGNFIVDETIVAAWKQEFARLESQHVTVRDTVHQRLEELTSKVNGIAVDTEFLRTDVDEHTETLRIHGEGIVQLRDDVDGIRDNGFDLSDARVATTTVTHAETQWGMSLLHGVLWFVIAWELLSVVHPKWLTDDKIVPFSFIVGFVVFCMLASFQTLHSTSSSRLVLKPKKPTSPPPMQPPVVEGSPAPTASSSSNDDLFAGLIERIHSRRNGNTTEEVKA